MDTLNVPIGWMFVALTAIFALGLSPRWANRFYPTSPSFSRRLAAPVIFAALAAVCFAGFALQALSAVVIAGGALIAMHRRTARRNQRASIE